MKPDEIIQLIEETVRRVNEETSIETLDTTNHTHSGIDSPLLYNAPQPGLTASDGTLANAVIRIGEIEAALQKLNLLK